MSIRGVGPLSELAMGIGLLIAGFVVIIAGVSTCGCTPTARAGIEAKAATIEAVTCALAHAGVGKAAEAVALACDVELEMAKAIVAAHSQTVATASSATPLLMISVPNCPTFDAKPGVSDAGAD